MAPLLQAVRAFTSRRFRQSQDPLDAELAEERAKHKANLLEIARLESRNALAMSNSRLDLLREKGKPFYPDPSPRREQAQEPHVNSRPNSRPVVVRELAYATDPATGYPFVPVVQEWEPSKSNRARFEQDPLFGWGTNALGAFDSWDLSSNVPLGAFPRELFPERPSTLRTQIAQDAIRFMSRAWFETMPWYSGLIGHLCNYVLGSGMIIDVVSNVDPQLAQDVMDYLDVFTTWRWNDIDRRVEDSILNLLRDGEDALRLYPGDEYPQVRSVDTSTIRGPHNEINGPWGYGVLTSWPRDYEDVQAYNVWFSDNTQEPVSPTEMQLCKLDTTGANVKRGVPLAYKIRKQLPQLARLVDCMAIGEAARQSIPYVQQYNIADKSAVGAAIRSSETQQANGWSEYGQNGYGAGGEIEPGQVRHINKGQMFVDPPNARGFADAGQRSYMTLCETIANACNVPVWMVSGTTEEANYASALVAESPVVKVIQRLQGRLVKHYKAMLQSCVMIGARQGRFPLDVLDDCQIHVELPTPIARNRKDEVETDIALMDKGCLSPQHLCARNELDFEEEQELTKQAELHGWQNEMGVIKGEQPPGNEGPEGEGGNGAAGARGEEKPAETGNESRET